MGLHALTSLKDTFGKAARRVLTTLAILGGSVLYAGQVQAQQQPAAPDTTAKETPAANANKPKPAPTFLQMLNINDELDQRGRDRFTQFLYEQGNGYSRSLDSLEKELRGYEQRNNPGAPQTIVILDPLIYDVGIGLGLSPPEVVTKMLIHQGIFPSYGTAFSLAKAMQRINYVTFSDDTITTQYPSAYSPYDIFGNETRVIVPISDFALSLYIPGLTRAQMVEFTNLHEGWHATDYYNSDAHIDYDSLRKNPPQTAEEMINNIEYMKTAAYNYNVEVYADLGAAGEMIRKRNYNTNFLDVVSAWRRLHPDDPRHMSPPVLSELKERITEMGIDKFRALDEKQAAKLYADIMDDAGMTVNRMQLAYQYMALEKDARFAFLIEHQSDRDFAKAYAWVRNFFPLEDENDAVPAPKKTPFVLAPELQAKADEVCMWDARAALEKEAIRTDSIITRVSMAKAYVRLMSVFDEDLNKAQSREDRISVSLHMARLKSTYLETMEKENLVLANLRHNINPLDKDPTLQEAADKKRELAPKPNLNEIRIRIRL